MMQTRAKAERNRMSLRQHLRELRRRVVVSAIAIGAGTVGGWFLSDIVWAALRAPVTEIAHAQSRMAAINYPSITSAFDLRFQTAVLVGIAISSPVWLYEAFAFVVPGLKARERLRSIGFVVVAVPLFVAGCAAGWSVLPHIVELMASFAPVQSATLIDASSYFSFVLKLVIATGIAFVIPVFLVMLNVLGVLAGRTILHSWRVAVIAIALFTAIATPSADIVSMVVLAVPMLVLFFGAASIAVGRDHLALRRTPDRLNPGGSVV
jgi:sec-independent protein translocase protein TatC